MRTKTTKMFVLVVVLVFTKHTDKDEDKDKDASTKTQRQTYTSHKIQGPSLVREQEFHAPLDEWVFVRVSKGS